jgi:hypothetical protein
MSRWTTFRNEAEVILAYGVKYIFPVVAAVAPQLGLPIWAAAAISNIIPSMMSAVEAMATQPGTGPVKKAQVISATQIIINDLEANVFTGTAKVNFDKALPIISLAIDNLISLVNEVAPQIIASDTPTAPPLVAASQTPGA